MKNINHENQINNAGFTLVELMVVIAIMGIMTGLISFAVGSAFNRDDEVVATNIDSALSDLRLANMSRSGNYYMDIKQDASTGDYTAFVYRSKDTTFSPPSDFSDTSGDYNAGDDLGYVKIPLGKKADITFSGIDESAGTSTGDISINGSEFARITFNKSKGEANVIKGSDSSAIGNVYQITVTAKHTGRVSVVNIINITGRHYVTR